MFKVLSVLCAIFLFVAIFNRPNVLAAYKVVVTCPPNTNNIEAEVFPNTNPDQIDYPEFIFHDQTGPSTPDNPLPEIRFINKFLPSGQTIIIACNILNGRLLGNLVVRKGPTILNESIIIGEYWTVHSEDGLRMFNIAYKTFITYSEHANIEPLPEWRWSPPASGNNSSYTEIGVARNTTEYFKVISKGKSAEYYTIVWGRDFIAPRANDVPLYEAGFMIQPGGLSACEFVLKNAHVTIKHKSEVPSFLTNIVVPYMDREYGYRRWFYARTEIFGWRPPN